MGRQVCVCVCVSGCKPATLHYHIEDAAKSHFDNGLTPIYRMFVTIPIMHSSERKTAHVGSGSKNGQCQPSPRLSCSLRHIKRIRRNDPMPGDVVRNVQLSALQGRNGGSTPNFCLLELRRRTTACLGPQHPESGINDRSVSTPLCAVPSYASSSTVIA